MTFETWSKLFDYHKQHHNFKTNQQLYDIKPLKDEETSQEWFKD